MIRIWHRRALGTFACLLLLSCGGAEPAGGPAAIPEVDALLRFELVGNHVGGEEQFAAVLELENRGREAWPSSDWKLYFNFGRMPVAGSPPESLRFRHVNGDLFVIEPAAAGLAIAPGKTLRIPFRGHHWLVRESDAPAGAYLILGDRAPQSVPIRVAPFERPEQTRRHPDDQVPVATPASRFEDARGLAERPPRELAPLLPTPTSWQRREGSVELDDGFSLRHGPHVAREARFLQDRLRQELGFSLDLEDSAERAPRAVLLDLDSTLPTEGYRLEVDPWTGISIHGGDAAGVFYGIQSLLGWVSPAAFSAPAEQLSLPAIEIHDAPRFRYRGLHLDVARNFHDRQTVEKLLDLMAFYKLNRFHFHLTDDEGWRLPVAALPELTEVGGRRGHTPDELDHLQPSFGSGPDPEDDSGSGWYSRKDLLALLRHAGERQIEVIAEIDFPGHARAAIRAMEARAVRLRQAGRADEASEFLLQDPRDTSVYRSVQMWDDNVVDVCLPSTYRFLEVVFDEVVDLWQEAGMPLEAIHLGGDEVPAGVWEGSPSCAQLREENPAIDDLASYFLQRASDLLAERGLATAGWEEIALATGGHGGEKQIRQDEDLDLFRPYVWNTIWGWGDEDLVYRLANAGYEVVLSGAAFLYFDLAYEKDPVEPGYAWAGFVDTRRSWELVPLDLLAGAESDFFGHALPPELFADRTRLSPEGRRRFRGIQGQLWGENARGRQRLEYFAFPKVLGLAERAWAARPAWAAIEDGPKRRQAREEAWSEFAHRLGKRELPRLDGLLGGVRYRLPPPGALIEHGILHANVAFPGLAIRFTTDGRDPTARSALYERPVPVPAAARVRVATFDTRGRRSRIVTLAE